MIYLNPFSSQVTIETQFMDDTMEMSDFSTLMDEVLAMDKTPTAEAEYRNLTKCLNSNLTDLIAQMMPTMEDDKVRAKQGILMRKTLSLLQPRQWINETVKNNDGTVRMVNRWRKQQEETKNGFLSRSGLGQTEPYGETQVIIPPSLWRR